MTPDNAIELVALAEKVVELSQKELEIRVARDGMGLEYSADNSRLRSEMPDLVFTSYAQAIRELHAWYETKKDAINRELLLTAK